MDNKIFSEISIIIPVFNDQAGLEKCLESLSVQTYPGKYYEIIVVDNGSDENIDLTSFSSVLNIRVEKEKMQGSYIARNKGITVAKGDIFAFIDSDCIAEPDWLEKGVEFLKNSENVGLVGGKVNFMFLDPEKPNLYELYDSITYFDQERNITRAHFGLTGNLFTYRKVVDVVGSFNEKLKSGGDREWGQRVHDKGYQLIYGESALVWHPARFSFDQIYRKTVRVSGGFEQKGNIGELLYDLRPPLRTIKKAFTDKRVVGIWQKFKLIFLVLFFRCIHIWTKILIILGKKSARS